MADSYKSLQAENAVLRTVLEYAIDLLPVSKRADLRKKMMSDPIVSKAIAKSRTTEIGFIKNAPHTTLGQVPQGETLSKSLYGKGAKSRVEELRKRA